MTIIQLFDNDNLVLNLKGGRFPSRSCWCWFCAAAAASAPGAGEIQVKRIVMIEL